MINNINNPFQFVSRNYYINGQPSTASQAASHAENSQLPNIIDQLPQLPLAPSDAKMVFITQNIFINCTFAAPPARLSSATASATENHRDEVVTSDIASDDALENAPRVSAAAPTHERHSACENIQTRIVIPQAIRATPSAATLEKRAKAAGDNLQTVNDKALAKPTKQRKANKAHTSVKAKTIAPPATGSTTVATTTTTSSYSASPSAIDSYVEGVLKDIVFREVHLAEPLVADKDMQRRLADTVVESDFTVADDHRLISDSCKVFYTGADGKERILGLLVKNFFSDELIKEYAAVFNRTSCRGFMTMRGAAAGKADLELIKKRAGYKDPSKQIVDCVIGKAPYKAKIVLSDGTVEKLPRSNPRLYRSYVMRDGAMHQVRDPKGARALSSAAAVAFRRQIAHAYSKLLPDEYAQQTAKVARSPQSRLENTPFTEVGINREITFLHKDKGNFGPVVITTFQKCAYQGGYTVFPAWKVGFDIREGDLFIGTGDEFHGNYPLTAITGTEDSLPATMKPDENANYQRMSVVHFARVKSTQIANLQKR